MAVWRRKALTFFPALRREINDHRYSVYMLYFDLLPLLREAHAASDTETSRKIYGFAEWCFAQRSEEPHNAVAVAFYEHLFGLPRTDWPAIIRRLPPAVIEACWPLWELQLEPDQLRRLQATIANHAGQPHRRDAGDIAEQRPP